MLSPRLDQCLGLATSLHLPTYNKETGLAEYVKTIYDLIDERIKEIEKCFKLKNDYISAVLTHQRGSVIEYDNLTFSFIHLLIEVEDFYCMVSIKIGNFFLKILLLISFF